MSDNSSSSEDESTKPSDLDAGASNRPSSSGGTSKLSLGNAKGRFNKRARYRRKNSEDDGAEAGGSGVGETNVTEAASVVDKTKNRAKTQNCRRRKNTDTANGSDSDVQESSEEFSGTATFHKLQKRVKHRSYRRTVSDCEEDESEEEQAEVAAIRSESESRTDGGDYTIFMFFFLQLFC